MKKCDYCGGENADSLAFCHGCGTELVRPPADAAPPRDWGWLGFALRYGIMVLGIVSLYFLSFGPVQRYCTTVIPAPGPLTAAGGPAVMRTTTVRYPLWVGVVYHPAFRLAHSRGGNNVYGRYIQWWMAVGQP